MPSDILQQIDDEKQKLSSSGEIDPSLSSSLDELNKKASESAQVMSVVESIWNSTASSGKNLHERISDLVKDFQVYESIVEKSIQGTSRLGSEYDSLGANGIAGVNRVNASLTQSLSLLQTVEREVQKYQSILASTPTIPAPSVSSAKPPVQQFANGGKVQGSSKHGDKNLARVNAGEWVFTEKQVDNLRRITGASSSNEVFRMSGGIPGRTKRDSSGLPMYSDGKVGDSLKGRSINNQLSSARTEIENRFGNSKTHESTKVNLESADESLRKLEETLKNLSKADFDRLGIDTRIENIFQRLAKGTKNGSRELQSITRQIDAVVDIVNQDAEAMRQAQLALDSVVDVDLSKYIGDTREFAEALEKANKVMNSSAATAEEKEAAKKDVRSNKSMFDLSRRKYLTKSERAQRQDITERYKNAGSAEERESIAKEASKLTEDASSLERSITLADSAWINFNKDIDDGYESIQKFLGGTPSGMAAVAVAIGYVANEMSKMINSFSDATLQIAKLNIESANTKSSFDSLFGEGQYQAFADTMSLTREEMASLAPVITDAYRSAGVEMEHISMIAENIKNSFGELSPEKLKEALSVMGELTSDQQKILLTGSGSSEDRSSMYANLMESGKAGQAADLIEQGVFGEKEDADLNKGDKAIVENLRELKVLEEDIKHSLVDGFGGILGPTLAVAKTVGTIGAGIAQVYSMSKIVGVGMRTVQGIHGKIQNPMPVIDSSPDVNAGGNVPSGGAQGGGMGGMAAGMIASVAVSAIVSGFQMLSEYSEKQARIAQEKKDQEVKSNYTQTGIYAGGADLNLDWDKVNARAAKYGAWGAGIGGTIGGIGAAAGTFGVGTAAGAVGGAVAGGAAGYALGASLELQDQLGDNAGNRLLYTEDGELNVKMLEGIATTNAYLAEIKKNNKAIQKAEVASLRLLETTGIIVKKVKKGEYSRHFDLGTKSSQKNIELMGYMGGNDSGYSSNVSSILTNSASSFTKNMGELQKSLQLVQQAEGVNAEAKIQATREILDQQAEVTRKFAESVYNSIGEYNKIPSVIQNSLQSKIQSMSLNFNNSNAVGTSALNSFVAAGNSRRANQNAVAAARQYVKEKPEADRAVAAAQQQYQGAVTNLRNQTSNLNHLGVVRGSIVREDGTIDEEKLGEAREGVTRGLEAIDTEIQNKTGIQHYSTTEAAVESFEKSSSEGWQAIDNDIAGMDEDQFEAKREEIAERVKQRLDSDIAAMEAIVNNPLIDPKVKQEFQVALGQARAMRQQYDNSEWLEDLELEDFRKNRGTAKSSYSQGSAYFNAARSRVQADGSIQRRRQDLGTADSVLSAAAQAQDAQTMALRNQEKMTQGLINAASDSQKAAQALVDSMNNDPMIKFYQAQQATLEANKDYLMATGNYAEYLSGQMSNVTARISALTEATNRAQADFDQNKASLQTTMSTVLTQFSGNRQAAELVGMISNLSELQQRAVSDPSLNGDVMAQSQAINAYIDRLRASDPNGENKETQELINQAMLMIGLLTSMNGAGLKIQENQAKARSMQFTEFKKIIAAMGEFRGQLKYMAWSAAKDRNTAQSNLSSANLNVDQVSRLSDEARQQNAELYRQDLEGIETERTQMIKGLDEQLAQGLISPEQYAQERSIIENKSNQATAEATLKYQQAQVDAAKREYDVKMKIVDLAQRGVDIQLDVAQSIGAPMETIVALERQRVQLAEDAYNAAHKQYQDLVNSGATQEEIEEAKLKMQKAQADVIKNQVGAQRSMMEKVFGNMIGSFGENAGIMGPNNLARKYGYGYGQGKDGTVTKGGKSTGGYRSRIFANNAMGNVTTVGLPQREGIGSSGAASTPGSGTSTGGQQPPVPKPGSGGPGVTGAGDKTKSDADFAKLGEKFASEKEGIEAAVFWEKKIYNVLVQDLVPGIKGIKGGNGGTGFIDGVTRRQNPRARNPVVDPNAPKNNGGSGNSGVGVGNGFTNTGDAGDSGNGNSSQSGTSTPTTPGTGGNSGQSAQTNLPSVPVTDTPQGTTVPNGKFKLKNGVTLAENDYFDENTGIIYHGGDKQVSRTLNDDGTYTVDNASSYRRTLADGTILDVGMTDANMSVRKTDAMVEAATPAAPAAAGTTQTPAANSPAVSFFKNPITQPFSLTNLLSQQPAAQPQSVFTMSPQQLAEWRKGALGAATPAAPAAAGTTANPPTSNPQPPTPPPAETPASAGTQPASTGASSQSGGGKTTIEVQVKFNSQMFEEQVKRITMQNAPAIVSTGTGADKK